MRNIIAFFISLFICLTFLNANITISAKKAKHLTEKNIYSSFIKKIISDYSYQASANQLSYENLIDRFPNNKTFQKNYFFSLVKAGNLNKAYQYGCSIVKGSDPETLTMLGYLSIALNNYEAALSYLNLVTGQNFLKGIAYYEQGHPKKALKMFKKAYLEKPFEAKMIWFFEESSDDYALKTINYLKNLEQHSAYKNIIWWYIANLYEDILPINADFYYNKILELEPDTTTKDLTYKRLGQKAFLAKKYDKAFSLLQNIKNDKTIHENLAEIYAINKNFKKAVKYQKNPLKLSYYYDHFNPKKSLRILKKLHKKNPKNKEVNFYLAIRYFLLDDFKNAIKFMHLNTKNQSNYSFLVKEMLEVERIYLQNIKLLKFSKNKIKNKDKQYLKVLSRIYFDAKLKIKSAQEFGSIILKLDYNHEEGIKIKIFQRKNIPNQILELSSNELKKHKFLGHFIRLITQSQNYKIITDQYLNVTSIQSPEAKLFFKKTKKGFNLPVQMIINQEEINIKYLDFQYNFKEKSELTEKLKVFNESKS
ncbi:MAG: hypothetical protein GY817_08785 [bacterium]|nr:hypothetical protein [bacterium]